MTEPRPPSRRSVISGLAVTAVTPFAGTLPAAAQDAPNDTYTQSEIVNEVANFFGTTSEAAGKAVEVIFRDLGEPNAYIYGEEGAGAIVVGLRYGNGWLVRRGWPNLRVYWQGPSVGWDFGGNASKVFTLVYNLKYEDLLFQRFPGVEGSFYFIAGIGVNYQRASDITLAPMRTGVGLRAGANVGYLAYTRESTWVPF